MDFSVFPVLLLLLLVHPASLTQGDCGSRGSPPRTKTIQPNRVFWAMVRQAHSWIWQPPTGRRTGWLQSVSLEASVCGKFIRVGQIYNARYLLTRNIYVKVGLIFCDTRSRKFKLTGAGGSLWYESERLNVDTKPISKEIKDYIIVSIIYFQRLPDGCQWLFADLYSTWMWKCTSVSSWVSFQYKSLPMFPWR